MRRSGWPSTAPSSSSAPSTPMCSRTPGAQANAAAYLALLQPGDTVLGMALDQGGHLTHGSKVNFSGKLYNFVPYGVTRETEMIDYDAWSELAREHKPKLIVAGFSAYPAQARLRPLPPDRRQRRRAADGRHRARRRAGRGGPLPQPNPALPRRHHHHPQDAARPPRRDHPLHRGAGREDR